MNKQVTIKADTIEKARQLAAEELGVPEDQLTFEVLQQPQKKVFGLFGGAEAVVRATAADNKARGALAAARACDYLKQTLEQMGAQGIAVDVEEKEDGCTLKLTGENVSFIIGRRGETLDALQYLTGLVANRYAEGYYRLSIDVGDYREKRAAVLVNLAQKTARQVLKNGRKASLEPMNPYERRIIHTAIQEVEGVTSWSVGSEDRRHVVIGLEGSRQDGDETGENNNRSGNGSRGQRGRSRGGRG